MAQSLKAKSGTELRSHLKSLRGREKELIVEILNHLKEVESRKLFLQWGYASMYEFCLEELGYSKDEAYIRIQGMRALKAVPEIAEKVKDGSITLSVLAKSQIAFNRENQKRREEKLPVLTSAEKVEVLKAVEKSSARECDRTLATFFPDTKVRPELTKPVSAKETLIQFTADEILLAKLEKLKGLMAHKNYNGSWEGLFSELADMALKKFDKLTTDSGRNPAIAAKTITASGAAAAGIGTPAANTNAEPPASMTSTKLQDSKQRSAPNPDLNVTAVSSPASGLHSPASKQESLGSSRDFVVTKRGALRQNSNPDSNSSSSTRLKPNSKPSPYRKYISVHVKRAVWRRAQGACQYIDASTGKRCNSKHALQLDHVKPLALGGSDELSNLRLLSVGASGD